MWYTGRSTEDLFSVSNDLPFSGTIGQLQRHSTSKQTSLGVATSKDGIHWKRGVEQKDIPSSRFQKEAENIALKRNDEDWWAFDTESLAVSDVQV